MSTNSDSSSDSDDSSQSTEDLPKPSLKLKNQDNQRSFFKRYCSYKDFPLDSAYPTKLAKSGLSATGRGDEVDCATCGFTKSGWKEEEIPFEAHARSNPECVFILYSRNMADSVEGHLQLEREENKKVNRKDESSKTPGVNRGSTGNNLNRRRNEADVVDKAICHKCFDADSCVLFLPCRHLICCQECAEQLDKCLSCHERVTKKIMVKRA